MRIFGIPDENAIFAYRDLNAVLTTASLTFPPDTGVRFLRFQR
jgi:hypothetical protein